MLYTLLYTLSKIKWKDDVSNPQAISDKQDKKIVLPGEHVRISKVAVKSI
jgi:hypothetical protein